jgi:RNA polymerase primary sigma factor
MKSRIAEVLQTLDDRQRTVILLRYGLIDGQTKTLEDVGKVFGVSRERIRQIEMAALRKLSLPAATRQLIGFLDWLPTIPPMNRMT